MGSPEIFTLKILVSARKKKFQKKKLPENACIFHMDYKQDNSDLTRCVFCILRRKRGNYMLGIQSKTHLSISTPPTSRGKIQPKNEKIKTEVTQKKIQPNFPWINLS